MDCVSTCSLVEYQTAEDVLNRGIQLEGMTFREVLNLGIFPDGISRDYGSRRYKGGLGVLIEERFFGYKANSEREPDFAEAGVELKATCFDIVKRNHRSEKSAGERLSLTMIPFDEELPSNLFDSHLWYKCKRMLLVWYHRDRTIDPYDQTIEHVILFTPPEGDLKVIERDYSLIANLVQSGRADELSESLTVYLGAATKGANAASLKDQSYYAPGKKAKGRVFSFKRSYMDYVLRHYVLDEPEAESLIKDPRELGRKPLTQYVTQLIGQHIGKSDRELCELLGIEYTGNKAQWTTIVYGLLGIRGERAAEFEKAGIKVRTLRVEPGGRALRESFPIMNIDFEGLAREDDWFESDLREHLIGLKYLLVVFEKAEHGDCAVLKGCKIWGIPEDDLDGQMRLCWKKTVAALRGGISFTKMTDRTGRAIYHNNLPGITHNSVGHVRPRAQKAAYRFEDGTEIGNVGRDAERLPDGRWMTRQAFWLNNSYMLNQIIDLLRS